MISSGLLISLRWYVGKPYLGRSHFGNFGVRRRPSILEALELQYEGREIVKAQSWWFPSVFEAQSICIDTRCGEEGKLQIVR